MYNILWNKWEKKTCVDLYFFLSTVHLQDSKIVTFGLISLFCPLCTSPVIWWNALEMWFINQTLSFYRFCSVFLKRIHGGIVARQWCSGCRWRFFFFNYSYTLFHRWGSQEVLSSVCPVSQAANYHGNVDWIQPIHFPTIETSCILYESK